MKKLILATGNQGKVKEMADLLAEFGFDVYPQSDFQVSDADETGTTFIENAIIKARNAAKHTGLPAIADDSGLEVDFINGAPGVYSARYAGEHASDQDNIDKLLAAMRDVPEAQRTARFHCVLAMMKNADDPTPIICHGVWEGQLLTHRQGENGFGYDPIFWIPELNCSSAQLAPEQKKRLSHRAKALTLLFEHLKSSGKQ